MVLGMQRSRNKSRTTKLQVARDLVLEATRTDSLGDAAKQLAVAVTKGTPSTRRAAR
jgi:hypothetical protein